MIVKKILLCSTLALICFASPANAAPAYTNLSNATLMTTREESIEIALPASNNPMGCGLSTYFRLKTTASNYQTIVATILSAIARGKSISVYTSSCDSDGFSLITAVQVPE